LLPGFDYIDGLIPDYMLNILLGVTIKLAGLWFESSNHSEEYYLGRDIIRIDKDLMTIKPPSNILEFFVLLIFENFEKHMSGTLGYFTTAYQF